MNRLPQGPNLTPTRLQNPSLEEFVFSYNGGREKYVLAAYDIKTFPKYIADLMASGLADKIIGKRGIRQNYQQDKEDLLKEIFIK